MFIIYKLDGAPHCLAPAPDWIASFLAANPEAAEADALGALIQRDVPAGAVDVEVVAERPDIIDELDYALAVQLHLDTMARSRGYDGAMSLASYAVSTNPAWAAEAAAFVAHRDVVWAYALAELAKVKAGERSAPTVDAFVAELPPIVWPD